VWLGWMKIAVLILWVIQLQRIESKCPNFCSGHGLCGPNNVCSCDDGWDGEAADCSRSKSR
jgi:hypothetical protein